MKEKYNNNLYECETFIASLPSYFKYLHLYEGVSKIKIMKKMVGKIKEKKN